MVLLIGKLYEINVKKSYSFYASKNKFFAFSQLLTGQACELVNQLPDSRLGV